MKPVFSDFAARTRVAGASVPGTAGTEGTAPAEAPDEVALAGILRLLDRARSGPLSPTDRAFVRGARAVFAELVQVCDDLLSQPPASAPAPPVAAAQAPMPREKKAPPPGSRAARPRRGKPGGAASGPG